MNLMLAICVMKYSANCASITKTIGKKLVRAAKNKYKKPN